MVVAIKEENSSRVSEERRQREMLLAEKMHQMRLRLQESEQRRAKLAKAREELLKVDHRECCSLSPPLASSLVLRSQPPYGQCITANFDLFKRATEIDAANEQCPVAHRRMPRRPLERTSSWVW